MKAIQATFSPPQGHWVGDGFPVRSLFSYNQMGAEQISPFLLLDYAGPAEFSPTQRPRGVGQHPHKGFETVTIVYQGELEHRDSSGGGGLIGQGDVQWMTAGSGILHEEFHSPEFTKTGGALEMVQLWVNLPAADKSKPAKYQTLLNSEIPKVKLGENAGQLRVIAGNYLDIPGPASTFTDINLWDINLKDSSDISLSVASSHTVLLVVLNGSVQINETHKFGSAELICFARDGESIELHANTDTHLLLLSGEPINEPVEGYGPFVMNSKAEINQAISEFQSGKFGSMTANN